MTRASRTRRAATGTPRWGMHVSHKDPSMRQEVYLEKVMHERSASTLMRRNVLE